MARHRASGHTIGVPRELWQAVFFIRNNISGQDMLSSGYDDRECRVLLPKGVRIWERATYPLKESGWSCSTNISLRCLTSGILLRRHSIRIFRIRRLTPDGRGGRFNFPGQTYPDPLIALTRRVSQPFCTVPRCSPKASRYVPPTF